MSRLTQSTHLCFGLHCFLLPGGTISRFFRPTYSWYRPSTCANHNSLAFLHLSVMFSTLSISLMSSCLTWSRSVKPQTHMHLFISVIPLFSEASLHCSSANSSTPFSLPHSTTSSANIICQGASFLMVSVSEPS